MIVVADTSPINYLIQIEQVNVLNRLYGRVLVPPAVFSELTHAAAPPEVREWAAGHPAWLEIIMPEMPLVLARLDPGESEAIALAIQISADVVLIDDHSARQEATRQGLKVAGTLSVLDDADQAGLLRFDDVIARLRKTSFRVSDAILAEIAQKRTQR
jgi:predicted nucleic acid-binding protein